MGTTSIDDVVEQWIRNVPSLARHVGQRGRPLVRTLLATRRQIITIIAFITLGSLFSARFLLIIVIAPLILVALPFWIERAIEDVRAAYIRHHPKPALFQTDVDVRRRT